MIYNEKDILKGSERACGISLKDARELFDSRKDSTLNVVRYIVNIVNEYINDIQSGYHNANYYGVGVHEKIVSILEANPKVLEDKLIKRQVESCFLNLLCHDIEEFNVYNSPLILSFMKKYLNVGNAFLNTLVKKLPDTLSLLGSNANKKDGIPIVRELVRVS